LAPDTQPDTLRTGRRIRLHGVTQGVGLRPFIHRVAREYGVTGRASNSGSGVTIEAFGSDAALDRLLDRIGRTGDGPGEIERMQWEPLRGCAPDDFAIDPSTREGELEIALAPDLATCPECLRETRDPADRRFGYAFTSCTTCGPRFTIARELPYDRSHTSMDAFALCGACRREYDTPGDRRHHAETNACPDCGPRLRLASPEGQALAQDGEAIEAAGRLLVAGGVVALRGIGGYHIAVDATDAAAVARLRARKRRPRKPFAVMVRDLGAARLLAHISPAESALLASPQAPIVLLRQRAATPIVDGVAPDLPWIGLLLPYTPLHQLLVATVDRPLVMTSGNRSGEPIACDIAEAEQRLGGLVDGFLHHDREINAPCDDSVAQVVEGQACLVRRSRGYVPRPFPLARPSQQTLLACGAQLSGTVCLARGPRAWLSQHLGDLDSPEAALGFAQAVERMEHWLGEPADVVAHDLHPHYVSTRYALAREAGLHVAVQHHHAHAASAMAEHGLDGPVLAVVFDGTGLGSDGTAWGGEVLLADASGFERLATLRPIQLAGGEVAIREVWRLALAMLEDAFDGAPPLDALAVFRKIDGASLEGVRAMLHRGLRCLPAHGAGRWFDALGALVLESPVAAHQGDVAVRWQAAAAAEAVPAYPFELGQRPATSAAEGGAVLEIDLRPMVRAALHDHLSGRPAALVSGRFHATLAAATAAALARLRPATGARPVVLTGGCFQNELLVRRMRRSLESHWRVYTHERVPPGDGGLALGQALVARAAARRGGVAATR
jgi:hydrogenase maturation protein HypF